MKKTLITLFFSCIISLIVLAINNQPNYIQYIKLYTNNGKDVIERIENVDSITYTIQDKHFIEDESFINQKIWCTDTIYNHALGDIDSIKICDAPSFEFYNNVRDFITTNIHKNEEKESVKLKINSYLSNSNLSEYSFDEIDEVYTLFFKDGSKANMSFFNIDDVYEGENNFSPRKVDSYNNTTKSFDVSDVQDEKIQNNTKLLYLWAGEFWIMEKIFPREEINGIQKLINESPLDIKIEMVKGDLSIIDNFEKYGTIVISKTHGHPNGAFYLCSKTWVNNTNSDINKYVWNYIITFFSNKVEDVENPWYYYTVAPSYFQSKKYDFPFIYGNYCWSLNLATGINNCSFIGYDTTTNYLMNSQMSISYLNSIFNGMTHRYATENVGNEYVFQNKTVNAKNNNQNLDNRYFSISMHQIEENMYGNLIISGKINGYSNLKSSVEYRLYYSINNNINMYSNDYFVIPMKPDGSFKIELDPYEYSTLLNMTFNFQTVINYNENKYYSNVKSFDYKMSYISPTYSEKIGENTYILHGESWASEPVSKNPEFKNYDVGFYYGTREDFDRHTLKKIHIGKLSDYLRNEIITFKKQLALPSYEPISWGIYIGNISDEKWDNNYVI